jgi:HEAT repeat protein
MTLLLLAMLLTSSPPECQGNSHQVIGVCDQKRELVVRAQTNDSEEVSVRVCLLSFETGKCQRAFELRQPKAERARDWAALEAKLKAEGCSIDGNYPHLIAKNGRVEEVINDEGRRLGIELQTRRDDFALSESRQIVYDLYARLGPNETALLIPWFAHGHPAANSSLRLAQVALVSNGEIGVVMLSSSAEGMVRPVVLSELSARIARRNAALEKKRERLLAIQEPKKELLAELVPSLTSRDPVIRETAAHLLEKLGDRSARAALTKAAHDEDPHVASAAARALARQMETSTAPAVLLEHPDPKVRALGIRAVLGDRSDATTRGFAALVGSGKPDDSCRAALDWFEANPSSAAVPTLIAALKNPELSRFVIRPLAQTKDPKAIDALVVMLKAEGCGIVGEEVAEALAATGDSRAINALTEQLSCEFASRVLGARPPGELLVPALDDPTRAAQATTLLLKLNRPEDRLALVDAYARFGGGAARLVRYLEGWGDTSARVVVDVFRRRSSKSERDRLLVLLADGRARWWLEAIKDAADVEGVNEEQAAALQRAQKSLQEALGK